MDRLTQTSLLLQDGLINIGKFISGLLFYFIVFIIIFMILETIVHGIFHMNEELLIGGLAFLATLPLGIQVNKRLLNQVKGKLLKNFLLILQAALACGCIGLTSYLWFLFTLESMRPF